MHTALKLRILLNFHLLNFNGVFCYSSEGHKAYVIPAGGSSTLGAWGYIDAFDEMMKQVKLINEVHVVGAPTLLVYVQIDRG